MISTLDSDDDTKLSKTEFLAATDLVHAMLQVREKEDNMDFITKVHQFSIKEAKAAICQAKVLLEPRVKQLQAMAAAARYQLKHSTRILCKQKCLLHKTSVMRAEISAARRAEREEEEQRQEEPEGEEVKDDSISLMNILKKMTSFDKINLTTKKILDADIKGSMLSRKIVKSTLNHIATGIINLLNIFDPEVIVLGGGVINSISRYLPELQIMSNTMALPGHRKTPIKTKKS